MLSIRALNFKLRITKTPTRQPGREPCTAKLTFETQSIRPSHTRVQMDESIGSEKNLRHSLSDLEAYTSPRNISGLGPIRLQLSFSTTVSSSTIMQRNWLVAGPGRTSTFLNWKAIWRPASGTTSSTTQKKL